MPARSVPRADEIVVQPEKAAFYPAVSRNGVETGSYGDGTGFQRKRDGGRRQTRQSRIRRGKQRRIDARYLPDRLRQLPRGRAAADLRLLC